MKNNHPPTALMCILGAKMYPVHAILSETPPIDPVLFAIGGLVVLLAVSLVIMLAMFLERGNTKK